MAVSGESAALATVHGTAARLRSRRSRRESVFRAGWNVVEFYWVDGPPGVSDDRGWPSAGSPRT